MKSLFLTLLLTFGCIVSTQADSATSANLSKKVSALNKVITLLSSNKSHQLALIQGRNQSDESIEELKSMLESQNIAVTVYKRGKMTKINEEFVLVQSLSTIDSTTKVFDSKIIISEDVNDIKSNQAGVSVHAQNGFPRVFISTTYFQQKQIKVDERLLRASTVLNRR